MIGTDRRRCIIAGLALVAALSPALRADEPAAPLESTKKELQQLQRSQKSSTGPSAKEGLSVEEGTYRFVPQGSETPQRWLSEQLSRDRLKEGKGESQKRNWLVNGVRKLETEADGRKTESPGEGTEEAPGRLVDEKDPGYLLKLFDDQKPSTARQAETKPHHASAPDPFAPFLQGWLGSSPVRTPVLEQMGRAAAESRADGSVGSGVGAPTPAAATNVARWNEAARTPAAAPKSNPYLDGLDVAGPAIAAPGPAAVAVPAAVDPVPATLPTPPPLLPAPERVPEARSAPVGPPPSPADERKYFPQLKRF